VSGEQKGVTTQPFSEEVCFMDVSRTEEVHLRCQSAAWKESASVQSLFQKAGLPHGTTFSALTSRMNAITFRKVDNNVSSSSPYEAQMLWRNKQLLANGNHSLCNLYSDCEHGTLSLDHQPICSLGCRSDVHWRQSLNLPIQDSYCCVHDHFQGKATRTQARCAFGAASLLLQAH
jgi:hypothetical protein